MTTANESHPTIMHLSGISPPKSTDWDGAKAYVNTVSFFDKPSYFAANLCKTIPRKHGTRRLLDVGCGSGIVGIYSLLERRADRVTFNDIQWQAIAESYANVVQHITQGRLQAEQATFMEPCPFQDIPREVATEHDLIVFNPPQIPERYLEGDLQAQIKSDVSMAYFRLGGADGLTVLRAFLQWYRQLGRKKPQAVVQLSSFIGRSLIEKTLGDLKYEITVSDPVPLRQMFWSAARSLSQEKRVDRMIRQNENGDWTKHLLTAFLRAH